MSILDLLQQDHITPKHAASTHGGEYHSPCPVCGGNDRFQSWPDRGDGKKTTWWCRQCDKGGDDIEYLKHVRKMSYPDACEFLGQQPKERTTERRVNTKPHQEFRPREVSAPSELWNKKAEAFISWAEGQLWKYRDNPVWERLKGFKEETIRHFRLGLSTETFFRYREDWGLPTEPRLDGKPKKLWLPSGLVIPNVQGGAITQIRIRPTDPEVRQRYITLRKDSCLVREKSL